MQTFVRWIADPVLKLPNFPNLQSFAFARKKNPRKLKRNIIDGLWARIIDPIKMLESRTYQESEKITINISGQNQDDIEGTYTIETDGKNSHHLLEATFKTFARCLKSAIVIESNEVVSTKGLM